jgi:hypothetical protein
VLDLRPRTENFFVVRHIRSRRTLGASIPARIAKCRTSCRSPPPLPSYIRLKPSGSRTRASGRSTLQFEGGHAPAAPQKNPHIVAPKQGHEAKLKYCGNSRLISYDPAAPIMLNHGLPFTGPPNWRPLFFGVHVASCVHKAGTGLIMIPLRLRCWLSDSVLWC